MDKCTICNNMFDAATVDYYEGMVGWKLCSDCRKNYYHALILHIIQKKLRGSTVLEDVKEQEMEQNKFPVQYGNQTKLLEITRAYIDASNHLIKLSEEMIKEFSTIGKTHEAADLIMSTTNYLERLVDSYNNTNVHDMHQNRE